MWSITRWAQARAASLALSRNAVLGYGYSFDRLHPTNGFNPLTTWILIPAYQLLPRTLPLLACYRIGVLVGFMAEIGRAHV